jgi:HSP20 family protein
LHSGAVFPCLNEGDLPSFYFGFSLGRANKKEVIHMELVPWRPFGGELSSLRREMDSLWNRFFGETPLARTFAEEWSPTVDISESKDNFIIKAELPGVDERDVNVSISGDILTVKGEKKKEAEEKDEHHYRAERYYGSFQRSFQLPTSVKADKIEAAFEKGVLKVTLPKVEEAKKKKIEVKVK